MPRKLLLLAAAVALTACTNSSTSPPRPGAAKPVHATCSGVAGKHHAYVVVVYASGGEKTACAGFDGGNLSGFSLMKDAGIPYASQSTQYGPAVCQVDGEPAHYDKCLPANAPYWASWLWNGQGWTMAQQSFANVKFTDRQALGWVYTSATASPAPPPAPPST